MAYHPVISVVHSSSADARIRRHERVAKRTTSLAVLTMAQWRLVRAYPRHLLTAFHGGGSDRWPSSHASVFRRVRPIVTKVHDAVEVALERADVQAAAIDCRGRENRRGTADNP